MKHFALIQKDEPCPHRWMLGTCLLAQEKGEVLSKPLPTAPPCRDGERVGGERVSGAPAVTPEVPESVPK